MTKYFDDEQLNLLLARPAAISDRGFTEALQQRTLKLHRSRRNLFLITGLGWFMLVLLVSSPQALYVDLTTLVQTLNIGGVYSFASELLQYVVASAQQQSPATLATALLSLLAVAGIVVRA